MSGECPRCEPQGMDSLTAIVLLARHGARVTFGPMLVRVEGWDSGWIEVASASTFVDAVGQAAARLGWKVQ